MNKDEKRINRQFLRNLLLFVAVIIVGIIVAILILLYYPTDSVKYVFIFFELLLLIVVSSLFKGKLERITNISYLIKIMSHPGDPLPLVNGRYKEKLARNLTDLGFERYSMDNKHTLYYRVNKDYIKKTFRRYMLEVVVVIHDTTLPFYLEEVDSEIAKIQTEQLKNRVRFDKMLITQIKDVLDINDKVKEELREIIFVKTKYSVISAINVGLHQTSSQAVMLYSSTYSPSLYYTQHIETIKKII